VGGYVQNLATKYLILAAAGLVFSAALIFVILASLWALVNQTNGDWVAAAGIMAAILALVGFVIVLLAYGVAEPEPPRIISDPMAELQAQIPSMHDIGDQIERASARYGPARVMAAAAVAGVVAGLAARRVGLQQLRNL
jgi:hypothetical protein